MLVLARRAFDAYAQRREVIDPPHPLPALLRRPAAVFVSAMRPDGSPRCCMGSLYPTQPDAAEEIIASAVAAAGHDRRFPPLRPAELSCLTLIVSFVSRPRPITAYGYPGNSVVLRELRKIAPGDKKPRTLKAG